jgi:hypothetical protein
MTLQRREAPVAASVNPTFWRENEADIEIRPIGKFLAAHEKNNLSARSASLR